MTDDLDIPDFLRRPMPEDWVSPVAKRRAKKIYYPAGGYAGRKPSSTLATGICANIDEAGKEILREQKREAERLERTKQRAREENRERAKRVLAAARAKKGKI